eukprot:TRINITY_DN51124_c0_g1_i1.p1 TRINITY_DN51124_c0_g1~~TRINITY_DN51124_c0_g1_i1.p1  ORF type:complete len:136 (+),score=21.18 TRINITY_DN51124_c0_g1_i1:117-524(+)
MSWKEKNVCAIGASYFPSTVLDFLQEGNRSLFHEDAFPVLLKRLLLSCLPMTTKALDHYIAIDSCGHRPHNSLAQAGLAHRSVVGAETLRDTLKFNEESTDERNVSWEYIRDLQTLSPKGDYCFDDTHCYCLNSV